MLGLIFATSACDFFIAKAVHASDVEHVRRRWLQLSLLVNLTVLGFFKYYDFFAKELEQLIAFFGGTVSDLRLNIVLPVGVSFYTFQTMSYTIDVYHRRIAPTQDPVAYFSYIAFFPQLVAGPIERASHLLPQFTSDRQFSYKTAVHGCRLILWGFFKKLIVADSCSVFADEVFRDPLSQHGWTMMFGCTAFAFQIYGDFSGYSDIARGLAMTLGFDLMRNFNFPYFSRNPAEFWRRWHISLSTWFRDYVYFPLGGNRVQPCRRVVNLLVVFTTSGLWHGANWTFLTWGLLNGILVLPFAYRGKETAVGRRRMETFPAPGLIFNTVKVLLTFTAISATWILFRSATIGEAWVFLNRMVSDSIAHPGGLMVAIRRLIFREPSTWAIGFLVITEGLACRGVSFQAIPQPFRWGLYLIACSTICWLAFYRDASEFIYFQF
jgi:alginate O-acetyltransferase complex protein AlgI